MNLIISNCISCGWLHENPKLYPLENEVFYICPMTLDRVIQRQNLDWDKEKTVNNPLKGEQR